MSEQPTPQLKPADFYANHRGGGLATLVNQRIAAPLAWLGWRLNLRPTHLTLVNLVVGIAVSVAVIVFASQTETNALWWPMGVVALVAWQFAYSLDCADGQLARTTGTGSESGARVDVLADIATQTTLVAAIVTVSQAFHDVPAWVGPAFAALWMTNLVTAVMAKDGGGQSLVSRENLPVRVVKLVRDYGFVITVVGVVLIVWPAGMVWVMLFFGTVNGLFLAASIAMAAKKAW
ncbi:CDP-alcohol phosphatidyltransferase family protein [Haloglycomyces albus]|uniref:CDP-alcohol phosphatidyltransferase family protein n=1 Tax=Haloglycomyces albus TaxID=526067 RepID=UPI001FE0E4DC|nr:CDP-alcohol phosphatidyltransferase family protein [Haloglycomyces albus]